jgi:cell division protein FtsZ
MAERAEQRGGTNDHAHRAVAQALATPGEIPVAAAEPSAPPRPHVTAIEDVTIRPMPPKPTLFVESSYEDDYGEQAPAPVAAPEAPFIPPQAERPVRAPRMPRIDELPIPAQNQIRARQSEGTEAAATADKPKASLLQRLASVGLGRREEEAQRPVQPRPAPVSAERAPPPMPKAPPMPPLPRPQEPRGDTVSEYAKRPASQRGAPQGLDQHGRPAPVNNSMDDDQLEIPAFLRRQAN